MIQNAGLVTILTDRLYRDLHDQFAGVDGSLAIQI
jgi:hypothetical protein